MIPLCLDTDVFMRYPLRDAVRKTAEAGFRLLNLNSAAHWEPHIDFGTPDAAQKVDELRVLLKQHELQLPVVEAADDICAWDAREREHCVRYVCRAMELLAPLGCRLVSLSTLGTNLFGIAEQHAFLKESLSTLSTVAADYQMDITIEIYPGSCLEKTSETIALLDDLDLPNIGYNLCVPHVAALAEDLCETYQISRHRLKHLHIADTPSSTLNHKHLTPGEGSVNFRPLFERLLRDGYDRLMTVQVYSYADEAAPQDHARQARMATEGLLQAAAHIVQPHSLN